jgi:hypothetical protein
MLLKTPDVTPAQILALVQAFLGLVVSFGFDLSTAQQAAVIAFCTAALVFLPVADAIVRHGRSNAVAALAKADAPVNVANTDG